MITPISPLYFPMHVVGGLASQQHEQSRDSDRALILGPPGADRGPEGRG